MPWPKGDTRHLKRTSQYLRDKAVEIANEVLKTTGNKVKRSPQASSRRAFILNTTRKKCQSTREKSMSDLKRFSDAQQRDCTTALT